VLFATAANAPPGTWEATAASLKPTRAQRVMLRQLWHAYAGRTQAIRCDTALPAAVAAAACCCLHRAACLAWLPACHPTFPALPSFLRRSCDQKVTQEL
jgi:hypothetical protein